MPRRRLPRPERAAYRRDDTFTARIREATTWRSRLAAGVDYLRAVLAELPEEDADRVAEQAALQLAGLARQINFGGPYVRHRK